jgi:hypothetical protein
MRLFTSLMLCPALLVLLHTSAASAQHRPEFSAGFGFGATGSGAESPQYVQVAFASVKWPVTHATKGGLELWWEFNSACVNDSFPGAICRRYFPVFAGVAPTISTSIGSVVEIGLGPGVFEKYYSSDHKSLVAGAVAHISASVLRSRYVNAIVSVRPFVGPPVNGGTAWVVPITLGLSR